MTDEEFKYADKILQNLLGLQKNCNHIDNFAKKAFNTSHEQTIRLIEFLKELDAIEPWNGMHRLTETGKEIAKLSGGTKAYVENLERIKQNEIIEQNEEKIKRRNERTLSKWKVITFWPAFVLGVIGGLYTILSIVLLLLGTSIEQLIKGKSENKESLPQQTEQVSSENYNNNYRETLQLGDTLNIE